MSATAVTTQPRMHLDRASSPRTPEVIRAVDQIIRDRFSCRYFSSQEVNKGTVNDIIEVARNTPSGNNMQPWTKVYCVSGDTKSALSASLTHALLTSPPDAFYVPEQFRHYPSTPLPEEFARRKQQSGKVIADALGIDRRDKEARRQYDLRNLEFFGAPVGLIFTSHTGLTQGTWLDVGFFIQNVIIAARARGLETVPQGSFSKYQAILREHLPIKDEEVIVCGMSLGYPDLEKIKQFSAEQPKRPVSDIVEYCGF